MHAAAQIGLYLLAALGGVTLIMFVLWLLGVAVP